MTTMNKKTVYIETSIVSYLTARASSDYASDIVIEEAGKGDSKAAARRLDALAGIPLLAITDDVLALSKALIQEGALPRKAMDDSLHIALSAVHEIDYLLTWNYRHIDNAETKPIIRHVCEANRCAYPEICTPQELMGAY